MKNAKYCRNISSENTTFCDSWKFFLQKPQLSWKTQNVAKISCQKTQKFAQVEKFHEKWRNFIKIWNFCGKRNTLQKYLKNLKVNNHYKVLWKISKFCRKIFLLCKNQNFKEFLRTCWISFLAAYSKNFVCISSNKYNICKDASDFMYINIK